MRNTRILIATLAVLALAGACYAAAQVPAIQKMLPAKNVVKNFGIMADSLQYGKGSGITKIYNGGYEVYTNRGVVDAVRQMYQRNDDYAEVTLHTMKSAKAATDFLKYWQKEHKVKSLTKSGKTTSFTIESPNVMTYFVAGKYFGTVSVFHTGAKAKTDVTAFRDTISRSFAK